MILEPCVREAFGAPISEPPSIPRLGHLIGGRRSLFATVGGRLQGL